MKIPGPVYLILGLIVTGLSWFIDSKTESSFALFFYIGLVFLAVGVFKTIVKIIIPKQDEQPFAQKPQQQTQQKIQQQPQQNNNSNLKYCPRCRVQVSLSNNFCYNCGTRLR